MSVVSYSVEKVETWKDRAHVITWASMTTGDTGSALEMPGSADRSVQVFGAFGGATLTMEGSNDGTNWATLTDPQGNNISITSAKIEQIMEITRYIRPSVASGSGTSLTASILIRR